MALKVPREDLLGFKAVNMRGIFTGNFDCLYPRAGYNVEALLRLGVTGIDFEA